MTLEDRQQKIESFAAAYPRLRAALERFPRLMWQFRPAADRWTIHEMIIHIADSEANSFFRCRRILAEPGSTVQSYDQNRWARELRYHDQSPDEALELFRRLRHQSYTLIQNLPETVWSNTVHHTERGLMSLEDWLDIYEAHIPAHIEQMEAVYADWLNQTGQGK